METQKITDKGEYFGTVKCVSKKVRQSPQALSHDSTRFGNGIAQYVGLVFKGGVGFSPQKRGLRVGDSPAFCHFPAHDKDFNFAL
ncbi:MAG: hypothetical protein MJK04_16245 [Psychrosphaera sp.]|nr:hypothetical protein [Psychrosphaera sp.]